jgi:hypothetical protein
MPAINKTQSARSIKLAAAAKAEALAAQKAKIFAAKAKNTRIAELQAEQLPQRKKIGRIELFDMLAFSNGMTRKQVKEFFDSVNTIAMSCMMPKGCGQFTLPGLTTLVVREIPAKKGGQTIMSFGVERISQPKTKTRRVRARLATQIKLVALPL